MRPRPLRAATEPGGPDRNTLVAGLGPRALLGAVGFLTILPVATHDPPPRLGRGWFPLVGVGIGALTGAIYLGSARVLPHLAAAVLALGAGALLAGGLHLDGLMDAADGLLGGATPSRRLEIMREPGVGAFGVAAGVLVLVGELACLAALAPAAGFVALVVTGGLSRLAMLAAVATLPYVRAEGLGLAAQGGSVAADLLLGSACAGAACLLAGPSAAVATAAAAAGGLAVAGLALGRVGGATGDIYGAAVEVSQLGALLVFAAVR